MSTAFAPWYCLPRRTIAVTAVLLFWLPICIAGRTALVIGNANYPDSPLKNPLNDARDMERTLTALGFSVILKENIRTREVGATLRELRARIKPGDEVLFFYAGHGLQVKGTNYLPAVDADIQSEDDVPQQSINVTSLLELLEESKAGIRLVFLDACRNNPYSRSFRSAATGLSRIGSAPSGTLISFATRPGSVASDGAGRNGMYTEQLLRHIGTEGLPIEQTLKRVAIDVENVSQGRQEPWMEGSIKGEFFFIPPRSGGGPGGAAQTIAPPGAASVEGDAWESARRSGNQAALEAYIAAYPEGRFVPLAKVELARLRPPAAIAEAPPRPQAVATLVIYRPSGQFGSTRGMMIRIGEQPIGILRTTGQYVQVEVPPGTQAISVVSGLQDQPITGTCEVTSSLRSGEKTYIKLETKWGGGCALTPLQGGEGETQVMWLQKAS